ncbi:MAG TPA: trypsin-like peptidase domain-containing protein, partial [Microbacteriaceae bacterium]|nr:trypsin-like peptidase domain-containing protein [Microbacteriaceae bacterium]
GAIVALAAAGAAVVGLASVGSAWTLAAVSSTASAVSQANAQRSLLEQALYGHGSNGSAGSGSSGSGSSGIQGFGSLPSTGGTGGTGTQTSGGTAATDAQSTGIVLINTVLAYQSAQAAGTGMVLTSDGEILTNNHVVAGATSISVTVASTGKSYDAKVVGTDATDDVAVLQLTGASGLTPANIDSSADVNIGDAVTGVGNAGGTGTLTAAPGNVTALDQTITTQAEGAAASETLNGLIQTNADIQSGDSGGPLYDANGAVIGIDTAASVGSSENQGYAIPIADALKIVDQIESGQETDSVSIGYPAFLGIEVGQAQTNGYGSLGGYGSQTGATEQAVAGAPVAGVISGGPAAGAGIVAGDTITAVDGTAIGSADALTSTLAGYEPGQSATITWTDAAGASHSATVTFAAGPAA